MNASHVRHVRTASLDVPYGGGGPSTGAVFFLMPGWPYDPRCYDGVVPPLVAAGCRVLVPYLRGCGATRFLFAEAPRSGQQAALGNDLLEMMDALAVERAIVAGYDWGGRAACIVAALWPERVRGLLTVNGYNIQDIARSKEPQDPAPLRGREKPTECCRRNCPEGTARFSPARTSTAFSRKSGIIPRKKR